MKTVYLSLGSNLGDREMHLQGAIDGLAAAGVRVLRVSPVYETAPVGGETQPWFLNAVVEAETELMPMQLLARMQRIEHAFGRRRRAPNTPRTLDIDILLFGKTTIVDSARLTMPHPRFHERRFVLAPLADL
ncbi:MAG: 2-amino-4-hydroxy-6-hydroxymethyldihydropteridine diphosphokinase, partial [Bryobacteraceae bacterium]